ncbi:MAG: hypothetical protein JOZ22_20540 [Acidobacteriia bacterium]|nr:hypothetical protein [Terriglobia bacterium]
MAFAGLSDLNVNIVNPIIVKPKAADNPYDGAGNYGTVVAFLQQKRDLVAQCLPPELMLEETGQPPEDRHPIAVTFGQQNNVRAFVNPPTMGLQYLESVIIIPRVYLRPEVAKQKFGKVLQAGQRTYLGPFNYMPRLYLDQLLPTIVGWALAYPKHWGRITSTDTSLSASTLLTGSPHYQAQITRGKMLTERVDQYQLLSQWLPLLNAPIVSRTIFGKLLFTKFYWPWYYAGLWDVTLNLSVTNSGVPALPPGQYSFSTVSQVPTATAAMSRDFAFITGLGWRLLLPFPREILQPGDGPGWMPVI